MATAALGRALAAASMMGNALKEENASLTLQIKGGGPPGAGFAAAIAFILNGRGLQNLHLEIAEDRAQQGLRIGVPVQQGRHRPGGHDAALIKDIGLKEPYIGSVGLLGGEIAEDLAAYFVESEHLRIGVPVQQGRHRPGGHDAALHLGDNVLPRAGEELDDIASRRLHALVPVHQDPQGTGGGDLLALHKVGCQVLGPAGRAGRLRAGVPVL